jgi:Zn finger protein HypA/HybF involved in hydrogenase expression
MGVVALHRTLEAELLALLRGASLECLVCGEFVMLTDGEVHCPECGSAIEGAAQTQLQLDVQAG